MLRQNQPCQEKPRFSVKLSRPFKNGFIANKDEKPLKHRIILIMTCLGLTHPAQAFRNTHRLPQHTQNSY
jgi:hypothetical protein